MSDFDFSPYRAALRGRICAYCAEKDGRGGCAAPDERRCAIATHVEDLVRAVLAVGDSPELEPYVAALRSTVCTHCRQRADGGCPVRDAGSCNLEAYLLPVIEVIEDVAKRQRHGVWADAQPDAPRRSRRVAKADGR